MLLYNSQQSTITWNIRIISDFPLNFIFVHRIKHPAAQHLQGEMFISIMDSANDIFIHNPETLFVQPKRKSIALYAAHGARSKLTATFLKTQLFCQTDHTHIARPGLRVNFILAAIKQIHNECA